MAKTVKAKKALPASKAKKAAPASKIKKVTPVKVKTVAKAKPKVAAKPVAKKAVPQKVVKAPAKKAVSAPAKKAASAPVKKVTAPAAVAKVVAKPAVATMAQQATRQTAQQPSARPVAGASAPVVAARPFTPTARPAVNGAYPHQRPGMPAVRPANDGPAIQFKSGDHVVYPAHGVGRIEGIETQTIGGMTVTLYTITFEKDRMRLKIPVQKAQLSGLRKLSTDDRLKDALKTLQGKAKVKRTMWSRRAQEYEAKINSGDPVQIAEVLRDLRRPKDDTEQSYSERQIYQNALDRLAREVAAVEKIAEGKAVERLETVLSQAA